jgi:hypothetical protein
MAEEWKEVVGFPGYQVSNMGNVMTVRSGVVLKPYFDRHLVINLHKDGLQTSHRIHRLVLLHFGPPMPFEGALALHRNDNPHDNRIDNLYWGSDKDNYHDSVRNGRKHGAHPGERHHNAKLKDEDIPVIKKRLEAGETCAAIAQDYDVGVRHINQIKLGRIHKHDATPFVNPGKASYRVTGEKHFNSKLTDAQVKEIVERLHNGERSLALAKEFGVSQSTMFRSIRLRKNL